MKNLNLEEENLWVTESWFVSDMNSARRCKLINSGFRGTAANNCMEPHDEAGILLGTGSTFCWGLRMSAEWGHPGLESSAGRRAMQQTRPEPAACACVWWRRMLCSLSTACWRCCELLLHLLLLFLLKVLLCQQPRSSPSTLCLSGRNTACSHEWRAYFTERHQVLCDHSSQRVKQREHIKFGIWMWH